MFTDIIPVQFFAVLFWNHNQNCDCAALIVASIRLLELFPSRAFARRRFFQPHLLLLSDSSSSNNHSSCLHQPSRYPSHCRHHCRSNILVIAIIASSLIPSSLHRISSPSVFRARSFPPPPPRSFLWSSIYHYSFLATASDLSRYGAFLVIVQSLFFSAVCRLLSLPPDSSSSLLQLSQLYSYTLFPISL